ncbi:MAG: hypothetical protein AAGP08_11560 [Pseudomonadota bacterium]
MSLERLFRLILSLAIGITFVPLVLWLALYAVSLPPRADVHWTHDLAAPLFLIGLASMILVPVGAIVGGFIFFWDVTRPRRIVTLLGIPSLAILLWVFQDAFGFRTSNLGTPHMQTRFERDMNAPMKRALYRFPDVEACTRDGELQLDWARIRSKQDAEVCTFRMLTQYAHVSQTRPWFEAQGFKISETASPEGPSLQTFTRPDLTLSLQAMWSVKRNGPKLRDGSPRRVFLAVPYGMSIVTTWSADGTKLLYVSYEFSVL